MTPLSPRSARAARDVVVVGGGIVGLAVAWRAARRGLSVTVCERGGLPSYVAAAHVAAGMLAPVAEADAQERPLLRLGLDSAARWPAFAAELEEASGLSVGYRDCGTLVVARDRDEAEHVDREIRLREALGVPVARLLPSAARCVEPALAPTIRAAFHAPDDHAVDPRAVCEALLVACERVDVELRPGCEVRAVTGGGVTLASGEHVTAGRTVVAAGAWAARIAGLPGLCVRPVKGQVLRLAARAGEGPLLEHVVRWDGGYLVPRGDGRVVLGATMEDRGYDTNVTALGVYELLRDAGELVPGVLELDLECALAGLRPATPDNAPLLGEWEGVVLACGHHRNGVLLTPATADRIAALLAGEDPHIDPAFAPSRFTPVGAPR
ncbi:glycine oxidase ThiO [Paraconexibacter antarcticus]|uniref:glycine oxidase n=1 Tax=Paraconexibacter antarcticus TaxID=2949664 RepID=A0ABY5DUS7_9ACTN|nr:glycine oxidase ThiO [Paraconexibacter antarcticus]UTI64786.1 glycine oxidase ThiO [Paraconexibacter antarcticus]